MLILTDVLSPGWNATVEGRTTAIVAADEAFRAVAVPAGSSLVVFSYAPTFTYAGAAIAAATALALLVWVAAKLGPVAARYRVADG
jgi:uncharacterized membrane protein YfhO